MKLKALLAMLLVGSLGLFGCSSSDSDDPAPAPAKLNGTASTALIDGDSAAFRKADGSLFGGTVLVNNGKFSYDKALLDQGLDAIVVGGGKGRLLNGGAGTPLPLGFSLNAFVVPGADTNVNVASQLQVSLFEQLPPDVKANRANAKQIARQQTVQVLAILVAPILTDVNSVGLNEEALFGAPSAYSESILLTALASASVLESGSAVSNLAAIEANPLAVLQNVAALAKAQTLQTKVDTAAPKIVASKAAVTTALTNNTAAIVANIPGNTDQAFKDAGTAVDTDKVPAAPTLNTLGFAALHAKSIDSFGYDIMTWNVNNSSSSLDVTMFGRMTNNESATRYTASGLVLDPKVTGLDLAGGKLAYDYAIFKNASKNGSVFVKGTFPGEANKYKGSTMGVAFNVVFNASGNSAIQLRNNNWVDVPVTPAK